LLSPYKAIVIPNIPWMDADQIAAIRTYKKNGGKIYTVGSSRELRELADVQSPASMLDEAQNETGRRELMVKINQLSGEQVITIPGTNYVAANVVKKTDSERVILHFVNYHTPLKNVRVSVNLDGVIKQIDSKRIQLFSPDGGVTEIEVASVRGTKVEFVLPELDVYDVVTIN
jgi:GTP-binding protein EngB required for normal cell division